MRKYIAAAAALFMISIAGFSQQSYLAQDGVAVFIPEGFNPENHLPSPIFQRDLVPMAQLPSGWELVPRFSTEDGKSVMTMDVDDADLYGTGEVYGPLRRNGDRNIFWNRDNGAYGAHEGKMLYQTHPWVLGLRKDGSAFGIVCDNTWRSSLYCDSTVRYESDGPAFRVVVIEKATVQEVLSTMGELSGRMELPPLWALGYQQCRFSYYPDSRVKEIADSFRERSIPCDVIWMDIHYMDGYRIFTFDPKTFPDPKGLNDYLHGRNFKSVYMIDPGAKVDSSYFVDVQGLAGDYFVHDAQGRPFSGNMWPGLTHWPDFSMPQVQHWWAGLYKDFMAQGVDGIWNDVNEPAVFGGGDEMTMPDSNIHRGGNGRAAGNHVRYHNIYGYDMVKASRMGILAANPDKRPFVLSRAGFLGVQRYAATWTGDNFSSEDHMKMSIPMTLNMGLTLQAFNGPDIGGFLGDCNPQLLRMWTATGVYFPFVRNHSCDGTVNQEPFAFDAQTEDICRRAINRRYRLLPYIYTLFEECSRTALPVMRPVFMADAKDQALRAEQQVYMLGEDLLVIPCWAQNPALPSGKWAEFRMEKDTDSYQAKLMLRPGAMITLADVCQNTEEYSASTLTVVVNPDADGNASALYYEDSGDGFSYKKGDFARYRLSARVVKGKIVNFDMVQIEGERKFQGPRTVKVLLAGDTLGGKAKKEKVYTF